MHCFLHLGRMREKTGVPLHETTTEPFEGVYSVSRRAYTSGTPNIVKQILENTYLRIKYGRSRYSHRTAF